MAIFKITFTDGRATIHDQTLDQILAFKIANLTDTSHKIDEDISVKVKKEKEIDLYELKNKFVSSLTPAQYNDVHLGNKTISYNTKLGYYLKVNKKPNINEIHHSHEYIKHKKHTEIKTVLKAFLIQEINNTNNLGYSKEELLEVANKF